MIPQPILPWLTWCRCLRCLGTIGFTDMLMVKIYLGKFFSFATVLLLPASSIVTPRSHLLPSFPLNLRCLLTPTNFLIYAPSMFPPIFPARFSRCLFASLPPAVPSSLLPPKNPCLPSMLISTLNNVHSLRIPIPSLHSFPTHRSTDNFHFSFRNPSLIHSLSLLLFLLVPLIHFSILGKKEKEYCATWLL